MESGSGGEIQRALRTADVRLDHLARSRRLQDVGQPDGCCERIRVVLPATDRLRLSVTCHHGFCQEQFGFIAEEPAELRRGSGHRGAVLDQVLAQPGELDEPRRESTSPGTSAPRPVALPRSGPTEFLPLAFCCARHRDRQRTFECECYRPAVVQRRDDYSAERGGIVLAILTVRRRLREATRTPYRPDIDAHDKQCP